VPFLSHVVAVQAAIAFADAYPGDPKCPPWLIDEPQQATPRHRALAHGRGRQWIALYAVAGQRAKSLGLKVVRFDFRHAPAD